MQLEVLGHISRQADAESILCAVRRGSSPIFGVFPLPALFAADLDDLGLLNRLARIADTVPKVAPFRRRVRQYLSRLGIRGFRRTVAKFALHARRMLRPQSLPVELRPGLPAIDRAVVNLEELPGDWILVLIGQNEGDPSTAEAARLHAQKGGRVVMWVMDLIPLICPEFVGEGHAALFKERFPKVARYLTDLPCISRYTQRDVETFLKGHSFEGRASTVALAHEMPGISRNSRGNQPSSQTVADLVAAGGPYLLCVGTIEVRKNGMRLLEAWQKLRSVLGDSTPRLIFCGRRGWKVDDFFALLESDEWLKSRVQVVSGSSDADIAFLHEHSLCSIYPSVYEGWGLPVGEAAWMGRACITSRATSMPEVMGDLAIYVDPLDAQDIADRVREVVTRPEILKELEARIGAHPLRTWREVAEEFRRAIEAAPISAGG